jgi:hypothetical protein
VIWKLLAELAICLLAPSTSDRQDVASDEGEILRQADVEDPGRPSVSLPDLWDHEIDGPYWVVGNVNPRFAEAEPAGRTLPLGSCGLSMSTLVVNVGWGLLEGLRALKRGISGGGPRWPTPA